MQTDRWRWERMLLLAVVLLGVVAMHATVAPPSPHDCAASTVHGNAHTEQSMLAATNHAAPGECDHSPGAHQVLHLCLAILAAALLLVLAVAVAAGILCWRRDVLSGGPRQIVLVRARPPPKMAVRLALLCVLRN